MPFGASITAGQDSTDGNGYRLKLQQLLQKDGNKVGLTGSFRGGDMQDNAFEAKPGRSYISDIHSLNYLLTSRTEKIHQMDQMSQDDGSYEYMPNVILINLGTDDCNVKPLTVDQAPSDYSTLLNHIKEKNPHATIIASSLLKNRNETTNACVNGLNKSLQQAALKAKSGGQKVVWLDMNAVVAMDELSGDGTHPTDEGYGKMAQAWYDTIKANAAMITAADPKGKAAPTVAESLKLHPEEKTKLEERPARSC